MYSKDLVFVWVFVKKRGRVFVSVGVCWEKDGCLSDFRGSK